MEWHRFNTSASLSAVFSYTAVVARHFSYLERGVSRRQVHY